MVMKTSKSIIDTNGYWSKDGSGNPTFWKTDHYASDALEAIDNAMAAKRIVGVYIIDEIVKKLDKEGIVPEDGQAVELWKGEPQITEAGKKEDVMFR